MLVSISGLWAAILLSAALCWVMSSLIHMLFKYHNADYSKLPNEAEVSAALATASPAPALYTMPYCKDMQAMGESTVQQKFATGPVAMISVMPNGMPPMGKLLGQQIVFFIIGSLMIGYLASISIAAGTDSIGIFRHVFVSALLAYGWAQVPYSIWMGQPWSNCIRYFVDAALYAAATACAFVWLWPTV